jgi:hypothetical protein
LLLLASCATSPGRFECGVKLEGSSEVAECVRNKEVCICATNSCAFRLDGDFACESGYRYAEAPFARQDLADSCVPMELVANRIEQTHDVKVCEKNAAGADAGTNGSGGGS